MAELRSHLQLFFFSLFAFSSSASILSPTLEHIPKTSVFNVSASIQKATERLSSNLQTFKESEEPGISSSTLKLYPRDILHTSSFKTYRDLTLSRLEGDAGRVSYLYQKVHSEFKLNSATSPVIPDRRSGEYFAQLGLGTPARKYYTIIDTGSDIAWIQCLPCTECFNQTDPIFDPSASSSYKSVSCDTQLCRFSEPSCTSATCGYHVTYGDGSSTVGDLATETLTIGKSITKEFAFGCGHKNPGLFAGGGLFGLSRAPLSYTSQTNTSAFSYCLVDIDSTSASTLEFGTTSTTTSASTGVVTAPLINNNASTFYYVGLTGISVGGKRLPIPPSAFQIDASGGGGVIVDSGTTATRFPSEVYPLLRDEFVEQATHLKSAPGVSILDTCFELTSAEVDVPTVALHFGDKTLGLASKNILIPVDLENIFCFAFAPFQAEGVSFSIIGNIQQQGIRVTFDTGRSVIRFSPNQC